MDFGVIEHFNEELAKYIDYFNRKRIKAKLNGLNPAQYQFQAIITT